MNARRPPPAGVTQTAIDDRATLYSSTEFKKIRLLYFTDDFKRWEAEHGAV